MWTVKVRWLTILVRLVQIATLVTASDELQEFWNSFLEDQPRLAITNRCGLH